MPLLSSQASSLGRRAVTEFTFQVAMRMPHNLPGGYDNGSAEDTPCRPFTTGTAGSGTERHGFGCCRVRALPDQTSADAPGVSRRCSEPPRAPIWRS